MRLLFGLPLGQCIEVAALIEVVEDGLDVGRHDLLALPVVLPQQSMMLNVGYHLVFLQLSIAIVTESTRLMSHGIMNREHQINLFSRTAYDTGSSDLS